ncbi:4-(cytidine 5'-diphospho)-2-C-methyl-D-erythritol kinase [candidate division KSB1 bacterium]|nr:4-(cytidine 5'-diphospho)-2-C-methyl-D-erythritol kinase [candidate division KSB1 bacterium]
MRLKSYAKINLGLHVVGKRSDGFHEIETIFQQIDLHDDIEFELFDNSITIDCDPTVCANEEDNLAYLAAQLLKPLSGRGCRIKITKNIPPGAGLGGGSSNAATTFIALNRLWDLHLSQSQLLTFAAQLGSDIPFFILGGTALGQGRGEILTPMNPRIHYFGVLILPRFTVSTKWAYQNSNFDLTNTLKKRKLTGFTQNICDTAKWQTVLTNDLEKIVFNRYPECVKILHELANYGPFYKSMSGSGSSLFGLFHRESDAKNAQAFLKKRYKVIIFQPM